MATVIVVPGIGGNNIYSPPALLFGGQQIHLWLNYTALAGGGWQLMALKDDGVTPDVPFTGPLIPGSALSEYYGTLHGFLDSRGHYVQGANLDWRGTMSRDGRRLAEQIKTIYTSDRVHLVCHSRGGLVARSACGWLAESGDLGRVGRVITLGTPHYGSWAAAGMLAGWEGTISLINGVLTGASAALAVPLLLRPVMRVVCSWPGVYELLPSPAAPGISHGEIDAVYRPDVWQWAGSEAKPIWLSQARANWLFPPGFPTGIEVCSVVGLGCSTPTRLVRLDRLQDANSWEYTSAGDGVVPAAWAVWPGSRVVRTPTGHSAMTYDPRVFSVIERWLSVGIPTDETLPGTPMDWGVLG